MHNTHILQFNSSNVLKNTAILLTPSSPEDNVIIEVVAGSDAGDCALWSKAGFDEGPRVEHAQQGVDEYLHQEPKNHQPLYSAIIACYNLTIGQTEMDF